jgi:hypothetical protein
LLFLEHLNPILTGGPKRAGPKPRKVGRVPKCKGAVARPGERSTSPL